MPTSRQPTIDFNAEAPVAGSNQELNGRNSVSSLSSSSSESGSTTVSGAPVFRRPLRDRPAFIAPIVDGFCYLNLVSPWARDELKELGPYPMAQQIVAFIVRHDLPVYDGEFVIRQPGCNHFDQSSPAILRSRHHSSSFAILCTITGCVGGKGKPVRKPRPSQEQVAFPRVGSCVSQALMFEMTLLYPSFNFIELPWGTIPSPSSGNLFDWWYDLDKPFEDLSLQQILLHRSLVESALKSCRARFDAGTDEDGLSARINSIIRYLDKSRHHVKNRTAKIQPEGSLIKSRDAAISAASLALTGVSSFVFHRAFRYGKKPDDASDVLNEDATREDNEFLVNPVSPKFDWGSLIADLGGVYLICCSSTSVDDLLTRLMGCVILKRKDLKTYFDTLKEQLTNEDVSSQNTVRPESVASDAAKALQEFQTFKSNFAESRLGEFFKSLVAATLCSAFTDEDDVLRQRLEKLDEVLPGASLKGEGLFDLILSIVTYVAEFIAVFERNPRDVVGFLFPSTCSQRMAWVNDKIQYFVDGTLSKCGVEPQEFTQEVVSLEVDLSMTISTMKKRDRYALRSTTQYQVWLKEIHRIQERMKSTKYIHNPRERPVCMCFHGKSSVGKTSLVEQTIALFCQSQGISSSEENIWRASDGKYHDGHLQNKQIYVFDDAVNGKFSDAEKDKLLVAQIVKFVNNAPYMSIQAEADKKGGIDHRPRLILITTNVPDLKCLQVTNDGPSMWNRINGYHVTVKPEFANPDGTINSTKCKVTDAVHNVCRMVPDFSSVAVSRNKNPDAIRMIFETELAMGSEEWQPIWVKEWNKHFKQQKGVVDDIMQLKQTEMCKHFMLTCHCPTCSLLKETEKDEEIDELNKVKPEAMREHVRSLTQAFYDDAIEWLAKLPLPRLHTRIGNYIARFFISTTREAYTAFMHAGLLKQMACVFFAGVSVVSGLIPFLFLIKERPLIGIATTANFLMCSTLILCHVKNLAAQCVILKVKRGLFGSDDLFTSSLKILAAVTICRQILTSFKQVSEVAPQGFFTNSPEQNLANTGDIWKKISSAFVPSEKKGTSTLDERFNQANKHMFRLIDGSVDRCGVFAITRDIVLTAKHSWDQLKDKTEIVLQKRGKPTSKERCRVLQVTIPEGTDWAYLHIDRQLQIKLTEDIFSDDVGHTSVYYPSRDGSWRVRSVVPGTFTNGAATQVGYQFYENDTEPGMCITPVFGTNQPNKVVALHMGASHPGGSNNVTVAFALTPRMIRSHLENTTMMVPHSVVVDDTCLPGGKIKSVLPVEEIHPRCCVLEKFTTNSEVRDKILTIHGGLAEGVKPTSSIQKAFLSDYLPKEMDQWSPPVFKRNKDYAKHWEKIQNQMVYIEPNILEWAVNDYALELKNAITPFFAKRKPLTTFAEAVNGDPTDRFFNKIDINTSGGPGCPKKKEMFWRESEDSPLVWVPEVESASNKLLNDFLSGIKTIPRVSTSAKDEIVVKESILGKRKVRFTFCFSTPFLVVGKILFRDFNTFCCANPQASGLMGGMNHTNEDWGELHKLLTQFPHMFDSDYSGFDTSQGAQLFMAIKGVLKLVLPEIGYPPERVRACLLYIDAMRDAQVEYNHVLVSFYGLLKSGVWITLLVNGCSNNILYRVAYKIIKKEQATRFRKNCFLAVQGDDAGVSTNDPELTPEKFQRAFASFNMKITPGRKDGSFEWKKPEEITFCKRSFRTIYYGDNTFVESPIELESIWKCMYWKQSEIGKVDHCLANLRPFMLEISRHPHEVYKENVEILKAALIASGLGTSLKEIPQWDQAYWIEYRLGKLFRDKADDPSPDCEKECSAVERC